MFNADQVGVDTNTSFELGYLVEVFFSYAHSPSRGFFFFFFSFSPFCLPWGWPDSPSPREAPHLPPLASRRAASAAGGAGGSSSFFFLFFASSGTSVQFVESVLPLLISNTYLILSPAQLGLAPTTTHLNTDAQNLHRIYLVTDSSH